MSVLYPPCRDHKRDCFSNSNGKCICLNDTNFSRPCPFYKTGTQAEYERQRTEERLYKKAIV